MSGIEPYVSGMFGGTGLVSPPGPGSSAALQGGITTLPRSHHQRTGNIPFYIILLFFFSSNETIKVCCVKHNVNTALCINDCIHRSFHTFRFPMDPIDNSVYKATCHEYAEF